MTIRQMALVQSIQKSGTGQPTAAEIEEAHQRHLQAMGTIEGLCLHCYGDHVNDKVELSDSVVKQIKDAALASAKDGYGWNDTDYIHPIMKNYVVTVEPEKRLAANRAMRQVWKEEVDRIGWYIHSQNPSWTTWGQPFNLSILDGYTQGIDVKA